MNPKLCLWLLTAILFISFHHADALQPTQVPRIGFLRSPERREAFRQGLLELGYVEGKNIVTEYRYAEGNSDRLAALAAELVSHKVHVIVTTGPPGTRAAKKATLTVPIVMAQAPDPVDSGFIGSLARPGGNITGLSSLAAQLRGKRLELLKEIIPGLSGVAVLGTSTQPANSQQLREIELAAGRIGVGIRFLDALVPEDDIDAVLRALANKRADALILLGSPLLNPYRKKVAELAVKTQLPAVHGQQEFVEAGGLMFYGASITDLSRRAATYVDKILKRAKPAELPVEQPTKFELLINLKTAKQIGLTIPPNVLARADKVIR